MREINLNLIAPNFKLRAKTLDFENQYCWEKERTKRNETERKTNTKLLKIFQKI